MHHAPPKLTGWVFTTHMVSVLSLWWVILIWQVPNGISNVIIVGFLCDGFKSGFKTSPETFKLPNSTMPIVATTIMVVNIGGASPSLLHPFTVWEILIRVSEKILHSITYLHTCSVHMSSPHQPSYLKSHKWKLPRDTLLIQFLVHSSRNFTPKRNELTQDTRAREPILANPAVRHIMRS